MGWLKKIFEVILEWIHILWAWFSFKDLEQEHYVPEALSRPEGGIDAPSFSELLPYLAWDDKSSLFVLEGSEGDRPEAMGFAIEVLPQVAAIPEMSDLMTTWFPYLPKGAGVQITLLATPLIQPFLNRYVDLRLDPKGTSDDAMKERRRLLKSLAYRQAKHLSRGAFESLVKNQPYLLREFRVVLSVVIPGGNYNDKEHIKRIKSLRDVVSTALQTYNQFDHIWGPEDLINWNTVLANPQKTMRAGNFVGLPYDDGRALKRQMVDIDTVARVTENGVRYGYPQNGDEMVLRCMTVKSYPSHCTLHTMGSMIGDYMQTAVGYNSPFCITLGVVAQDFEDARQTTQMKSARAMQKAESPMAKYLPELKELNKDWRAAQEAFDAGKGTVRLFHQILLWAPPDKIANAEQGAQAVWRSRGFELVPDTYMATQSLLSSLPMGVTPAMATDLSRAHRLSTKTVPNAMNMAPLLAEWRGIGEPIIPMFGRRGQVQGFDLFANKSGNYNGAITGKPGSGKSVLMNLIATAYLSIGSRVWIFDVGRSYEKLCRLIGGQYIEFTEEADIRLNPFSMVEKIDSDMEMLVPVFEQMISPAGELDDYRRRQLGMHIQSVWYDKGRKASVDDLAYSLINNCELGGPNPLQDDPEWKEKVRNMTHEERQQICDPRVRDMGMQLYPYTSAGHYGRYFMGDANVDFNNDFIVLELEELGAKKDLQAVVMFLLMYRITQAMYLDPRRSRPKLCLIDEAWQLLAGGNSADFIEAGYRRARKHKGAFISATQTPADYKMSKSAKAAWASADWVFLMRLGNVSELNDNGKFEVDDRMAEELMSVKTVQGSYAETFVHTGQMGSGISRIILDPFSELVYSSKAEDFDAVMEWIRKGLDVTDAVQAVLAQRGVEGFSMPNLEGTRAEQPEAAAA